MKRLYLAAMALAASQVEMQGHAKPVENLVDAMSVTAIGPTLILFH